ncbi:glycoside hydrolase family 47 protein [Aspergillus clavatus NRRL 1]|uniref:Probable mannosyl-oligosaccharide alpha-1,2-mannosidase 1B n=1 Tax=Aspergillus clavatus (strain ATCC 1007 / CBS 513.65 / DSM 816 / NCTC 3887 / NRRL 1 / QM 1276 / 107) TaxID=344612 RepID=MNS1B_ASPCL|nr:mannosidase MsdS [Aspergillus clavatus NRRL 1]A1CP08.1 RecName: Full=Probable mannosyl-oligosaccharide alpha-1,2-mannosidase 1B; AltName: Full=Class I alpha-mannosidase 1B; AltName: Full=Man(9)-alpha-mannosidase 1B; Flags: Precursor [Aspergillus clavatus NRRL 1]EAW07379.1 mannosidase MsdS [Aspergillus clavatus NRRL 1]
MHLPSLSLAWALAGSSLALPQAEQPVLQDDRASSRAAAVKEAFSHAWDGYKKYAFPHDELHPISNGYGNSRNGWGASAVDALSTAIVMRNATIVHEILDHIATIDYSKTSDTVSLFETTIRYLGGMLSGYDLLKGPAADLVKDTSKVDILLKQSKNLGDILKFAFDTPSGVPYNNINITSHGHDGAKTNGLAVTGTLVLEWTRLSDLTGDPEYAQLSQKAESYLLHPQPSSAEPFPGLIGSNIDIKTGQFTDGHVSWNGGDDSYYEYLIKMYVYDPTRFALYRDRWVAAAESSIEHLASHPASRPDLTFLATYDGGRYGLSSQHLACFDGGNFLLGGTVLDRRDLIDFGLALVDACHETYSQTLTGIGPESFGWDANSVPADQKELYERAGFYVQNGAYILRPEVIESFYYAWRVTGRSEYRDWVWTAFVAINKTCRTGSGYAGLTNVNAENGGGRYDNQESFLFAEVLKYAYLTHSEELMAAEDAWQVQRGDGNQFVFNTEAHPIRVHHS